MLFSREAGSHTDIVFLFDLAAVIVDPTLARLDDVIIHAHRHDVGRCDAQDLRREALIDRISALCNGLYRAAHFDEAWFPGREHIIHDEGHAPMA